MSLIAFLPFQLVQSILDQSHLTPLTTTIQSTLSDFDHALRLYPLPTAVSYNLEVRLSFTLISFSRLYWQINMTDTR